MIARTMAQLYPQHTRAIHLNFIPVVPPYPWRRPLIFLQSLLTIPFSAKDRASIARSMDYVNRGNGYMRQQETRPQTLGYGLHDSPVGLLAWIYDKLYSWSNEYPWTDDEILTWVSIYYFSSAGPTASTRIYFEASAPKVNSAGMNVSGGDHQEEEEGQSAARDLKYMSLSDAVGACAPSNVRFAVARFKSELIMLPMAWYRQIGNVVRESEFDRGGHFAAWEEPELMAADLKSFLGKNGEAYGVVPGREGY